MKKHHTEEQILSVGISKPANDGHGKTGQRGTAELMVGRG